MARTHYKSSISISFEFVFYLTYAYDDSGNILSNKRYAYTTDDLTGITPTETINYTYGNENWGDLLTAYNGKAITYDEIGNPLTYDGWAYTWKDGRRLATASDGTNTWSYKYNSDGIRTQKVIDGVKTEFFLNGTQIIAQKTGDDIMWFYYDHDGKRIGLEYQGAMYYYAYNLQGDVKYISDADGNVCGGYYYDDWGNVSVFNSGPNTVATANPFRYRGYYYDTETELYYLNSRYYNPEWGRFLNADGIIGANGDVISTNLFAYCSNNPINYSDPTGMCFWCGTPGIAGEKLREAAGCTEGKKTNTIQTNNKTTQSSKNTTKPGKENKSSFDAGVNITTNDSSSTMGGFYAVADDLPYLENPETASDMYKFGLGSYRAGIGTIFHQWEYGGLGVDIMTANADFNAKNIGIGFNIMSIKGNIRIPLPSGEYTVIEGDIGIGIQLGVGKSGFEATTDFVTYGINYYIE